MLLFNTSTANMWFGIFLCYIVVMAIYYTNTWNVSSSSYWNSFALIQGFSVVSFSDAFYIDLLCGRICIWSIRCFRFAVPTQSNCFGFNRRSSFDRFKCVGESHIKLGGESLVYKMVLVRRLIISPIDQIGAMIAHVALFWGPHARNCFKLSYRREQPDPHYQVSYGFILRSNPSLKLIIQAMQKYKETAWWWYAILLCSSFIAGKPF